MSRRAGLAACAAALVAAALAAGGRADTPPSTWDRARDPGVGERWALHVRVDRLLHPPPPEDPMIVELRHDEELRLEAARAMLEEAGAARSADVRLRFDLGMVYEQLATVQRRNDLQQKAIDVLVPALDLAPDHPAATQALESLVYAYAKLDRPRDELATWRWYIPLLVDDRARVAPLMNMGEAQMRLGMLDEALATFREGLALCETLPSSSGVNETFALTLWDVAIALDRSGDVAGALGTANKARSWAWMEVAGWGPAQTARTVTGWDVIRDESTVFFVPEWEREWYLALGFAAAATQADDVRKAAHLWRKAEEHWETYVSHANGMAQAPGQAVAQNPATQDVSRPQRERQRRDRWLSIARARLARARAARAEDEKRAANLPQPEVHGRGDGTWLDD